MLLATEVTEDTEEIQRCFTSDGTVWSILSVTSVARNEFGRLDGWQLSLAWNGDERHLTEPGLFLPPFPGLTSWAD